MNTHVCLSPRPRSYPLSVLIGKQFVHKLMSKESPPRRPASSEMIAKLIKSGYLNQYQFDDPNAITHAILRMKQDLRSSLSGAHDSTKKESRD